jgi:CubicO group peptidase (beta-lactamase class C family)
MQSSLKDVLYKLRFLSAMAWLLLILSSRLHAQKTGTDRVDAFIGNVIQAQHTAGLAVGIIKDGKIIKTKGYGWANLEHHIPVTSGTVFKIGSVSKHIVAVAIMKLVEENKLNLNDPVKMFYKDAPPHWNKITIRHLLNHTSGLQRESPAFESMRPQPDSILIRAAYTDTLAFPTGSKWQYCNLSYFILADIIRQTTGRPFPEYMKQEIFNKYGLSKTQVTSVQDIVPGRAGGYSNLGRDTVVNAENYIALRPSGAFLSNIDDMLKWEMLIQSHKILSQKGWEQMWQDLTKISYNNPDGSPIYYGYGLNVTTYKNRKMVFHRGSMPGFQAIYCRFPDEKTAIVILTNTDPTNTQAIAQGVADIIF